MKNTPILAVRYISTKRMSISVFNCLMKGKVIPPIIPKDKQVPYPNALTSVGNYSNVVSVKTMFSIYNAPLEDIETI